MNHNSAFIMSWQSHRNALLQLLDTVKDEDLTYKPWEGGMSLAELYQHIAVVTSMFVNVTKNGQFAPPNELKQVTTVHQLKEIVQTETEQTKATLEALTEEQLNQVVDFRGMDMSGKMLLNSAKDHEVHHKGQLFIYARMLGVESLPFFVSLS